MKVIHHGNDHLLCLSSEEVALLMDLCHAGVCSDLLGHDRSPPGPVMRLLGELQHGLSSTAQAVWCRRSPNP
ncbi:MAG: hypothetical protein ACKOXO_04400 [Cyanobium sp.]